MALASYIDKVTESELKWTDVHDFVIDNTTISRVKKSQTMK